MYVVQAYALQMVVIIDPHLKRSNDYPVYKLASDLGVLVKPNSGKGEYEGWCWPGSSSWIDFFHPDSWDFWVSLFKTKSIEGQWSWTESTDSVGIWNDMNEVCCSLWQSSLSYYLCIALGIQWTRDYNAKR